MLAAMAGSRSWLLLLVGADSYVVEHGGNLEQLVPSFTLPEKGRPLEISQLFSALDDRPLDLSTLEDHDDGVTARLTGTDLLFRCKVYPADPPGEQWLVSCDAMVGENLDVIEGMTLLTTELTNLSRELKKRNDELFRANARIEKLTRTDPLTGLSNRRHLMERLELELARTRRSNSPLALAMYDLDKFKSVNDTYGHAAGDAVLKAFAEVMRSSTRSVDLVARWGGEEFVLLFPETGQEEARIVVERTREAQARQTVLEDGRVVTVSFGLSVQGPEDTADALLSRADAALYEAKKGGRNQLVVDGVA